MASMYLPGNYSAHFARRELCFSARAVREGLSTLPPPAVEANLRRLCVVLESVRERWGPWRITSGYRSPDLNALTPGSSPTSAHVFGCAADGEPLAEGVMQVDVMDWLAEPGRAAELGVDQAILEYPWAGWIHLGIARIGCSPRHQLLVKTAVGYQRYSVWRAW